MPKGLAEIGVSGLRRWGSYSTINEEFLGELRGPLGVKKYREMRDNDPVIGSVMLALEQMMMSVEWEVNGGAPRENSFIKECLEDMDDSWSDVLTNILSMLTFGWALFEPVYKVRNGSVGKVKSRYSDKMIGWKKFGLRAQDTLLDWKFADNGEVIAIRQSAPPNYGIIEIPMTRCLLFRTTSYKDNPEGRSLLRNAYRSYLFKKQLEEVEGIGIERDLTGMPVIYYPPEKDLSLLENASLRNYIDKILRSIAVHEQYGLALPSDFEVKLLSSPGTRAIDTDAIIQRYDTRIAMTMLGQFIMLGSRRVGSFALAKDQRALFNLAIDGWLGRVSDVMNHEAIPRLLRYNGLNELQRPILTHRPVAVDLNDLANYIKNLSGSMTILDKNPKLLDQMLRFVRLEQQTANIEDQVY